MPAQPVAAQPAVPAPNAAAPQPTAVPPGAAAPNTGGPPPPQGAPPQPARPPAALYPPPTTSPDGHLYPVEDIDNGRLFALLGYLIFPLWCIPLIQRDNAFALFHAKQALTGLLIGMIAMIPIMIVAFATCGLGAFIALPLWYPMIMGIVHAANGEYIPCPWYGAMGENWFRGIIPDKRPGGWPPAPPSS